MKRLVLRTLPLALLLSACGKSEESSSGGKGPKDEDATCEESLKNPNHAEAREWCSNEENMGFKMTVSDMLKLAEEIYAAGAEKVYVTDIDEFKGRKISASFVVVLPKDGAARKRLFDWEAGFAKQIEEKPRTDKGQKYFFISLD